MGDSLGGSVPSHWSGPFEVLVLFFFVPLREIAGEIGGQRGMAMRCAITRVPRRSLSSTMVAARRWLSDGTGRILSEEERAKENVYIQKMERERLEKLRRKAEKEKAEAEKSSGKPPAEGIDARC